MRTPSSALPGPLVVETALAVIGVVLGLFPWFLFGETSIQGPAWYGTVWLLVALALVLLWVVLLGHLVVDVLDIVRHGPGHLRERGWVHAGFRVVESLGVVAAPVVLQLVAETTTEGPSAHGVGAIGGLFVVMGVLAANAVVVLLHAGWLLVGSHTGSPDTTSAS
jgi:hypothetical protein